MRARFIHKGALKGLRAALVAAAVGLGAHGQGQDLVQGITDGLDDVHAARQASLLVQQHEGVLMARFDVATRNMMLHVRPDCALDADRINLWLEPLGIRVRCFTRRDAQAEPFRHLDPARCGGTPSITR